MPERILIVDDDLDSLKLIGLMLQRQGYEILVANSGGQALGKALHEQPDLVILDIMMPDMDGYETMKRIRANRRLAKIPLISVTAKAMKGDRQKCLNAGASDYISKPVDIDLLLALLRVWIGRARADAVDARPAITEKVA